MRKKLQEIGSTERHLFQGTFIRSGFKTYQEHHNPTLLLGNILDETQQLVTEHLWFNYTLGFLRLGELRRGDRVTFAARVASYQKGHWFDRQQDFRLTRPTRISRVDETERKHHALPIANKRALIGYIMCMNETFYRENGRPFEDYYVAEFKQWWQTKTGTPFSVDH